MGLDPEKWDTAKGSARPSGASSPRGFRGFGFRGFRGLGFRGFRGLGFRGFRGLGFRGFRGFVFRGCRGLGFRGFRGLGFRGLGVSGLGGLRQVKRTCEFQSLSPRGECIYIYIYTAILEQFPKAIVRMVFWGLNLERQYIWTFCEYRNILSLNVQVAHYHILSKIVTCITTSLNPST